MRARFLLTNTVGLALIAAAWWAGVAPLLVQSDRVHALPIIGFLFGWALWLGWRDRWSGVAFMADKLPVIGLIGTVLGVLMAVQSVQAGDLDAARVKVFTEVGESLVSNLLGIAGYAWLSLLCRVCGREDA